MNRNVLRVFLHNKHTRSLCIIGIIFNYNGIYNSGNYVLYINIIGCKLIITMIRYHDFFKLNKF